MCLLEDTIVKNPDANKARKEVAKSINNVTSLMQEILKLKEEKQDNAKIQQDLSR